MQKAILICRLYKSVWNVFFCFFARLQTFMIVDYILRLVNEHSFRKSGFIWKVATSCSGWNYFGRERWGCLRLVGWYLPHFPPLSLALAKLKLGFWFQSLDWKSDPFSPRNFMQLKRVGRVIIMAVLYQTLGVMQFRMENCDYYVTFTKNSKSTKNECFVCRYSFHCDNITNATIKIFFSLSEYYRSQKQEIVCVKTLTTLKMFEQTCT